MPARDYNRTCPIRDHGDRLLCIANLVPRALFLGFGGREKRPGDEVDVSPGRERGGFWAKQGETDLADPPFECYFTEVIPLITFDDFRVPPLPPPHPMR